MPPSILPLDEYNRQLRIYRIFDAIEKEAGADAKEVIKDLYLLSPDEIVRNNKAMSLMKQWLTEDEWKSLAETGVIEIKSKLYPGRVYHITAGKHDLTQVYHDGTTHTSDLCVHADNVHELPLGDAILAKVLELKSNEANYLANSNERPVRATAISGTTMPEEMAEAGVGFMTEMMRRQLEQRATELMDRLEQQHQRQEQEWIGWSSSINGRNRNNNNNNNPPGGSIAAIAQRNIRLNDIAVITTMPVPPSIPKAVVDQCIKHAAAQAIFDNLAITEEGLAVRSLLSNVDFDWTSGEITEPLYTTGWRQPYYASGYHLGLTQYTAWRSNVQSHNDRKVICLYGVSNLESGERCPVERMTTSRPHGPVDITDISHIHKVGSIMFERPMLFKRNQDFTIKFDLADDAAGRHSRLMLLGVVAEPIGDNIV